MERILCSMESHVRDSRTDQFERCCGVCIWGITWTEQPIPWNGNCDKWGSRPYGSKCAGLSPLVKILVMNRVMIVMIQRRSRSIEVISVTQNIPLLVLNRSDSAGIVSLELLKFQNFIQRFFYIKIKRKSATLLYVFDHIWTSLFT